MLAIRPFRALAAIFALHCVVLLPCRAAAAANDLPRYDLPVGRTLSYSDQGTSKRADGATGGGRSNIRATVVSANADGSRRVVFRFGYTPGDSPEEVKVRAFDVFPDGRTKLIGRPENGVSASTVFPLLPPDVAPDAAKWEGPGLWPGGVTTYSPAPSRIGSEFVFTAVDDGPTIRLYVLKIKFTFRFDKHTGVVVGSEREYSQDSSSKQTIRGKMTLDQDETIPAARAARLAADYDKLLQADEKCVELLTRVTDEPANAARLAQQAKDLLATAAKEIAEPEVVKEFDRVRKRHEENSKYELEEAKRIAGLLDKSVDWSAKDLDGKTWSQADLKGKVVVMDFWYRGCGWCMEAMPQVIQLAADYQDKPVVVLGMNTDRKEEDARFVVKEFGLAYPQIKAEEIPKRLGVEAFPTVIIIDQAGVVRYFHAGYSANLREKVTKRIDELLQK